jgi:DNA topoisomerase-1
MKSTKKNAGIHVPKFLVIVESSSNCKPFVKYLGGQYSIFAIKGHFQQIRSLRDIPMEDDYFPQFSLIPNKAANAKTLLKEAEKYTKSNILIATDNDREGEAIAYHLCQFLQLDISSTKRLIFNEITPTALEQAIQTPSRIRMDIVYSQIARSIIDILIGFQISNILRKQFSGRGGLSAGRCQTIALRLIYEKQQQKTDNVPRQLMDSCEGKLFHIKGYFIESLSLLFQYSKTMATEANVVDFLEKSKRHAFRFVSMDKREHIVAPPKPLNTSKMLQLAHNILGYDSKKTMKIAQTLYEAGEITYLRTDSTLYSATFISQMNTYIGQKYGGDYVNARLADMTNNVNGNLSHEAIHPTDINLMDDTPLYRLIWKHSLQSCMSGAVYDEYCIKIDSPFTDGFFVHKIEIPVFLGWRFTQKEESTGAGANILPYFQRLSKEKPVACYSIECKEHFHSPNLYYTESSLIKQLEDLEIGRPSTYATFIETVKERGYVVIKTIEGVEEKRCILRLCRCDDVMKGGSIDRNIVKEKTETAHNRLVIEPLGILCIEFLMANFPTIFDYEYTKRMEINLDKIEEQSGIKTVCETAQTDIQTHIQNMKKINLKSFLLNDGYEFVFTSKEPCIRRLLCANVTEGSSSSSKKKEYQYMSISKTVTIDIDKLKRGEYTWQELVDIENPDLGVYENKQVTLRSGPYGYYLEWGEQKIALNRLELSKEEIRKMTLNKGIEIIQGEEGRKEKEDERKFILRHLDETMSVRQGKYGTYLHYMMPTWKKPKFVSLKKCPLDFMTCSVDEMRKWVVDGGGSGGGGASGFKKRFFKGGEKKRRENV